MKLAIFDVDGTLMDSQAMILASLNAAFTAEQLPVPSRLEMLGIVGLSLVKAMSVLRPDDEAQRHERLADAYKQAFWSYRANKSYPEIPFDGALDLNEYHDLAQEKYARAIVDGSLAFVAAERAAADKF